jgi:chaperonin GroES
MNTSGIEPVDLKVLVLPDSAEEKIGSIIVPDSVKDKNKFATMKCTLVATGANAFKEWGADAGPKVGERVLMAQYAGARTKGDDGQDYILMNDSDIIAVLRNPNG